MHLLAALRESLRQGPEGVLRDAALYAQDWGFSMERIEIRVDLWHGESDWIVPRAHAEVIARALVRGRLRTSPMKGISPCPSGIVIASSMISSVDPRSAPGAGSSPNGEGQVVASSKRPRRLIGSPPSQRPHPAVPVRCLAGGRAVQSGFPAGLSPVGGGGAPIWRCGAYCSS
jgi:hypothetical protein